MAVYEGNVDMCIVTVTKREYQATRNVLEKVAGKAMEEKDCYFKDKKEIAVTILYVEVGNFFEDWKRSPMKVALVSVAVMGGESSAQAVTFISQTRLDPSVIAMIGMCAGNDENVNLGDILVPFKITKLSGKEKADGSFLPQAEYIELSPSLTRIIGPFSDSDRKWLEFIPDGMKPTPSPLYFHDFILSKVPPKGTTTLGEIAKEMEEELSIWKISDRDEVIKNIVEILHQEQFVETAGDFSSAMSLSRTAKGNAYVSKNSEGGITEPAKFPKDPKPPAIWTEVVYSADVVSENIDFKRLARETGQRKLYGYELEGYSFLFSAKQNLPNSKRLFAKGVSDFGSKRSKLDYYQSYCAASAMAVVCYLFKGRDSLFPVRDPAASSENQPKIPKRISDEPAEGKNNDFPNDEDEVNEILIQAISRVAAAKWQDIALTLQVNTIDIKSDNTTSAEVKLSKVIHDWKLAQACKPTVKQLLEACKIDKIGRREIVKMYAILKPIMEDC